MRNPTGQVVIVIKQFVLCVLLSAIPVSADEPIRIWPGLAPSETTQSTGKKLPYRDNENPRVTRVVDITCPTMTVHLAKRPNGTAVVILPGGGFGKVVPDKEGTEAADWLNAHGVAAFVLSYRTTSKDETSWEKPLQDAQRALAVVRARAAEWQLKQDRIGLVAFSAGGQVAARLLSGDGRLAYKPVDKNDEVSHRPDFAILAYPWNIYDSVHHRLVDGVRVRPDCPPTFLVHTHDDRSSSLGAVLFYAELKRHGVPAELHVYSTLR